MSKQNNSEDSIHVWDLLIRMFHWGLVICFFVAYLSEDDFQDIHIFAGNTVIILLLIRLLWGVVGSHYARFGQFVTSPAQVLAYMKKMMVLKVPHYLGHNPAAAAMIVMLLINLIIISFTGTVLLASEQGQGVLAGTMFAQFDAEWMEEIHEFFANLTLLLVVIHVMGVVFSSVLEGENLVRAMVTGRKKSRNSYIDQ